MPMYNIPLIIRRDQGPSVSSNYEIVGMYVIRGAFKMVMSVILFLFHVPRVTFDFVFDLMRGF